MTGNGSPLDGIGRFVKRSLSCCWDHDVLATAPTHGYAETREPQWQHSQRAGGVNDLNDVRFRG